MHFFLIELDSVENNKELTVMNFAITHPLTPLTLTLRLTQTLLALLPH